MTFGGTAAASFTIDSDTQITAVTPAGSAGRASVLVTNATGTNSANTLFRYTSASGGGDPNSDTTVLGITRAQVALPRHATQQVNGIVQHRLELLHGNDAPGFSNGISFNVADRGAAEEKARNALSLASIFDGGDPTITGTLTDPTLRQMAKNAMAKKTVVDPKLATPDYRLWTEGSIIVGEQTSSGSDNSFRTSGLAAGMDTQLLDSVKAGFAFSLVFDKTKIGSDGSYNNGTAVIGTLYASWKVDKNIFVDAQLGYGALNYLINRYDSDLADDLAGSRSGNMFFLSLIASYDQKNGALKYAPFAGFDAMSGTLNSYTETGDASYILGYDSAHITSGGAIVGLRGQYDMPMAWGMLSPTGRLQIRHAFASDVTQTVYFDSDPSTTYSFTDTGNNYDVVTSSLGLKATGPTGISGLVEYSNYSSLNGDQANGIRGMVVVPF